MESKIKQPENWNRKTKNGKEIPFDAYVSLHTHSNRSLLDGMSDPKDIVDKTFKLGQPASCVTDHGVMFAVYDHYTYAKSVGQKPITGFEAYVVGNMSERTNEGENARCHLLLLAKNKEGYRKLSYWCSMGCTDGFYYKPRIDERIMEATGGKDIIATSACLGGLIPQLLLTGKYDEAKEKALQYKNLFENFYLEIQPTLEPEQGKLNHLLLKLSKDTGIELVATTDSHYTNREDSITHEILLCMQTQKKLKDPHWKFTGDTYYIATRKEMEEMFEHPMHADFPKDELCRALDNTVIIADMCNFDLEVGKIYLPKVQIPIEDKEFFKFHEKKGGNINQNYLRYLSIKSLKSKGLTSKEYRDRLDMELDVINSMGFTDYFLIYEDICRYCREADIPVGPGRGCFVPDSKVQLANGEIKEIKDIENGDIIIGHDEKPNKVLFTYEYDCNEKITELEIGDKKISCTNDHKIYAIKEKDFNNGIREPKWYSASELVEGDYICELDD